MEELSEKELDFIYETDQVIIRLIDLHEDSKKLLEKAREDNVSLNIRLRMIKFQNCIESIIQ